MIETQCRAEQIESQSRGADRDAAAGPDPVTPLTPVGARLNVAEIRYCNLRHRHPIHAGCQQGQLAQ